MKKRIIHRGSSAGFTLVELMTAIIVLTISLMAALATEITAINLVKSNRNTVIAMGDLQSAMEEMLTLPMNQIPPTFLNGTAIAKFVNRNLSNENIIPTYPNWDGVTLPYPDPLQILLTITWNDYAGRLRTLTLSSQKTQ